MSGVVLYHMMFNIEHGAQTFAEVGDAQCRADERMLDHTMGKG